MTDETTHIARQAAAPDEASVTRTPKRIWLLPGAGNEGETLWCDDPAPGLGMSEDDAVAYIRADLAPPSLAGDRERVQAMRNANWKPAGTYWRERAEKAEAAEKLANDKATRLVRAVEACGAMPEGCCLCSSDRIGDDSKVHEPECAEVRAALSAMNTPAQGGEDGDLA